MDSAKKQEALYVDVTRATHDLVIFCEDKERLYEQAEKSGANKIASNLVFEKDREQIETRIKELFPEKTKGHDLSNDHEPHYEPGYFAERQSEPEISPEPGWGLGGDDVLDW